MVWIEFYCYTFDMMNWWCLYPFVSCKSINYTYLCRLNVFHENSLNFCFVVTKSYFLLYFISFSERLRKKVFKFRENYFIKYFDKVYFASHYYRVVVLFYCALTHKKGFYEWFMCKSCSLNSINHKGQQLFMHWHAKRCLLAKTIIFSE